MSTAAEPTIPRGRAALAGLLGVGLALALTELFAALIGGVPSLVTAIGALVVPIVPPALEDWAIQTFGVNDKAVLAAGTVVIALLIGVGVGLLAARRRSAAAGPFGLFAALGVGAAVSAPGTSGAVVVMTTAASAFLGYVALTRTLDAAQLTGIQTADGTRRSFLLHSASVGAGVAVAGVAGRTLNVGKVTVDVAEFDVTAPSATVAPPSASQMVDIDGISPLITPIDQFYRIDTALSIPQVDPAKWKLRVGGMVDNPFEVAYDELLAMPQFESYVTISCVSNEIGGNLVGNARWQGVKLTDLLDRAGVQSGATQLASQSVDGWTCGFPTEIAYREEDAMLALAMNGEPLPQRHGFPARLIIPGLYGYVSSTKWISDIVLTTWEDFDGYWVPRGWAKEGPIKTQSRIDVPRSSREIPAGPNVVAGIAWAGVRGISKVEIQVADGTWTSAKLTDPLSEEAWIQWWVEHDFAPGSQEIRVRATDGDGETQTADLAPPRPDGATGLHTIRIRAV